jgi:hypothetical protein
MKIRFHQQYLWTERVVVFDEPIEQGHGAKIAIKTTCDNWFKHNCDVILPFSIQSRFHEGPYGKLKVESFISTIKKHVRGKAVIFLTDEAHLQVHRLLYNDDEEMTKQILRQMSYCFLDKHKKLFKGLEVVNYQELIHSHPHISTYRALVQQWRCHDSHFSALLNEDAASTYTSERAAKYPNKKLFIERAILDLLDQCVCLQAFENQGFRYEMYPGKHFQSTHYVTELLKKAGSAFDILEVCVSIEKKYGVAKQSADL